MSIFAVYQLQNGSSWIWTWVPYLPFLLFDFGSHHNSSGDQSENRLRLGFNLSPRCHVSDVICKI